MIKYIQKQLNQVRVYLILIIILSAKILRLDSYICNLTSNNNLSPLQVLRLA